MNPNFQIIVPVYGKPDQVKKCEAAARVATEFVLGTGSYAYQPFFFRDNNKDNVGFTKAVNDGLRASIKHGDTYAIILNQDCYLDRQAIKKMVDFMDAHPKCAIAGIKQLSVENPDYIIHGGCTEAFPAGRHIGGFVSKGDCAENKQMPWVNGACMIVRVSLIPEFGLMDENFFLVGSDSDWCYTARARGLEVWYIADATCVHEQGVSSGTDDKKLTDLIQLDMVFWNSKWLSADLFRELSMEVF